ncbi:MAG: chromosome partitioning protein ParB [Bacteroidetes bacterium]|nr:MAG: chromosome partitioning protein ParB [Bacteroidota bacterium]
MESASVKTSKRALGRGLSALLENANTDVTTNFTDESEPKLSGSVSPLPMNAIETNPFQPRSDFEKEALTELTKSILEHGIIQPVSVRKLGYDRYQLISGERRFKAAKLAGLTEIPVYIRIANDQAMLEMALVENIQRRNLNAIEIAIGLKRLIKECELTQEQLSEKVSKNRSTVANYLRLLRLPNEIQAAIRNRTISTGHARALINIEDKTTQLQIFQQILEETLSVRQVEQLARNEITKPAKKRISEPLSFQQQKIKEDLSNYFNTKVDIKKSPKGKGKITIEFKNDDDLRRISELLNE